MKYLNLRQDCIKQFKKLNQFYIIMKRKNSDRKQSDSDDSNQDSLIDSEGNPIEPGSKRAKMPKKSKYRMRAHINPMGDLTIPTYLIFNQHLVH